MAADLTLRNEVAEIGLSRADGRIVSWRERATGEELLRSPIGPTLAGRDPDPDGFLATVEETEEGHEALLYDPFGHGGVAVQIRYVLPPGEMRLIVEHALSNRRVDPVSVTMAWAGAADLPARWRRVEGRWRSATPVLEGRASSHSAGTCSPFAHAAGEISWDAEAITVRVARAAVGATLFIENADGRTLEAPASVYPERALRLPLGAARPVRALLRAPDGRTLLTSEEPPCAADPPGHEAEGSPLDWRGMDEAKLSTLEERSPRHLAHLERARRAAVEGRFADADAHLETALLTNGEDPLLWWQKAAIRRLLEPEGERAEWLNARFLRPLEPLVAAEAILAREGGAPVPDDPLMAMVAGREGFAARCVLAYEAAGLDADAVALATRILAVRPWPRVRTILAALHLERGMESEAAGLRVRGESPVDAEPREREWLARLAERFGPA